MNRKLLLLLLAVGFAGCATTSSAGQSTTQWITFPSAKSGKGVPLDVWLKENPLKPDQEIMFSEISRGPTSSSHLVVIRKEEKPHTHQKHDLVAIVLKGSGTFTLDGRQLQLKPGAIVHIPRGIPHAFVNHSKEPAVAFAIFMPAFDGTDVVPVQEKQAPVRSKVLKR